jgi:hypothetical protein
VACALEDDCQLAPGQPRQIVKGDLVMRARAIEPQPPRVGLEHGRGEVIAAKVGFRRHLFEAERLDLGSPDIWLVRERILVRRVDRDNTHQPNPRLKSSFCKVLLLSLLKR